MFSVYNVWKRVDSYSMSAIGTTVDFYFRFILKRWLLMTGFRSLLAIRRRLSQWSFLPVWCDQASIGHLSGIATPCTKALWMCGWGRCHITRYELTRTSVGVGLPKARHSMTTSTASSSWTVRTPVFEFSVSRVDDAGPESCILFNTALQSKHTRG